MRRKVALPTSQAADKDRPTQRLSQVNSLAGTINSQAPSGLRRRLQNIKTLEFLCAFFAYFRLKERRYFYQYLSNLHCENPPIEVVRNLNPFSRCSFFFL
ncbi:hypothetical protein VTO42DRAFT_5339 [Malbranchea cinnamomea]